MNIVIRKYFKTAEELIKKKFSLFNLEIIIPYEEFNKLEDDIVLSLKLQGNYFTFMTVK